MASHDPTEASDPVTCYLQGRRKGGCTPEVLVLKEYSCKQDSPSPIAVEPLRAADKCTTLWASVRLTFRTCSCPGESVLNVRIVGGTHRGRAEIFYNNVWGTICDDDWDNNDATVFCRMLGYSSGKGLSSYGGGE